MPGAADAKRIINERAAAVACGESEIAAAFRAIRDCIPNWSIKELRGFAAIERAYMRSVKKAADLALSEIDKEEDRLLKQDE
jgi:hypothetical protein